MNPRALRAALLSGRRRPRRAGAGSATQYRGDGYEFVELREYVPGDDPRRIDWAATARSSTLQTRIVLEDVALTLAISIDSSASMRVGRRRPLLEAAEEARDAWFSCALAGDRLVEVPDEGSQRLRIAKAMLPRGAALLFVTDGYDVPNDAASDDLLAALGERCDCTLLLARDPWHAGLPLRGNARIVDAETGAARSLWIGRSEARAFVAACRTRENRELARFARWGWRAAALVEEDGAASLYAAFGFAAQRPRRRA
jgi:hypothetical protein